MLRQNRTELSNCSFAKTVMMLIIILYHSILDINSSLNGASGNDYAVVSCFNSWLATFHNYTFVLISGYIFYFIKYENDRYKQFIPFVKKKFNRLIIPYFFILIVWAIPFYFILFSSSFNLKGFIVSYILGTTPSQLWFLLMLFWTFVFFFKLSDFVKNNTKVGIIIVILLHCVGVVATHFVPNVFRIFDGLGFLIFFYIGFLIRQYNLLHKINTPIIGGLVVADVIMFVIYKKLDGSDSMMIKLFNILGVQLALNIIGCILAFVVLQRLAALVNFENNKVYKYCEKRSMGIYLLHQQIVHICWVVLSGKLNAYIIIPITFITSLILSAVIFDLLCKFKTTRFLVGEK